MEFFTTTKISNVHPLRTTPTKVSRGCIAPCELLRLLCAPHWGDRPGLQLKGPDCMSSVSMSGASWEVAAVADGLQWHPCSTMMHDHTTWPATVELCVSVCDTVATSRSLTSECSQGGWLKLPVFFSSVHVRCTQCEPGAFQCELRTKCEIFQTRYKVCCVHTDYLCSHTFGMI